MFKSRKKRIAEDEFFARFGYQTCTADFIAFVIGEASDGYHDLIFVADDISITYSFHKFNNLNVSSSTGLVDPLCLAVEKVYRSTYDKGTTIYNEGLLTLRSYGKNDDGSPDMTSAVLRAYHIRKFSIGFMTGDLLQGLYEPMMKDDIYTYEDAWHYTEMPDGTPRSIVYNVHDEEETPA